MDGGIGAVTLSKGEKLLMAIRDKKFWRFSKGTRHIDEEEWHSSGWATVNEF